MSSVVAGQQNSAPDTSTTFCTYQDGSEVSIRYVSVDSSKKNEPPSGGKPWTPGGVPILLFTPTDLIIGNTTIPTGAYSVYPFRNRSDWTLVVNKNVTPGSAYDSQQDLARVSMETSKLPSSSKALAMSLGHTAPKTCSLQMIFGDTGAWADIKEK